MVKQKTFQNPTRHYDDEETVTAYVTLTIPVGIMGHVLNFAARARREAILREVVHHPAIESAIADQDADDLVGYLDKIVFEDCEPAPTSILPATTRRHLRKKPTTGG